MSDARPSADVRTVPYTGPPDVVVGPPDRSGEGAQTQSGASAALRTADLPDVPGYVVTREVARGGMAVVYAAHDPTFDREVAVKVMRPGHDAARFVVESKVTAQLPHPGIPPVYALGTLSDGRPYLAMKLIRGHTLAEEIEHRQTSYAPLSEYLGIFERICQAVGFAHAQGIIHRDLKPTNVMVGAFGEVQVMDWGLAKVLNREQATGQRSQAPADVPSETLAGDVKGTPAYMAPEQARGDWDTVDARADVFALGGILAAMLTGSPPFIGTSVLDTVQLAAEERLEGCFGRLLRCGQDTELIGLARRCLAPKPADRFKSAKEVADAVAVYRARLNARRERENEERTIRETTANLESQDLLGRRQANLVWGCFTLLLFFCLLLVPFGDNKVAYYSVLVGYATGLATGQMLFISVTTARHSFGTRKHLIALAAATIIFAAIIATINLREVSLPMKQGIEFFTGLLLASGFSIFVAKWYADNRI
jgi:eukaryotic-like serine/threonine-protein kinase